MKRILPLIFILALLAVGGYLLLRPSSPEKPVQATTASDILSEYDPDIVYDVVIKNGRVINPETKFDRIGVNVGIQDGKVTSLTTGPIKGKQEIDATNRIVAPGFVDLLSYDPNSVGIWTKIADGVTANIAMHGGTSNPESWYPFWERQNLPIHFGASFFYTQARNKFGLSRYKSASPAQIRQLVSMAEKALNNGCLGISFSLEYVPGITSAEIIPLMKLANQYNVPVFFHARYSDMEEPGTNFDALNELFDYARETKAAVHIDHINSTGGTFTMKESLKMVDAIRDEGYDFSACIYPYDFWATYLNSARFDKGWQERFRIGYNDLQLGGSSERLTKESYQKYRQQGKLAAAYAIPEEDVIDALKCPWVMMGSDAILEPGYNNHPRASGMSARLIGRYVREQKVLTLMDALAKLTILPARRLEKQCPSLQTKGRLSVGADADIVVFDFERIIDRATVEHPEYPSEGIDYVLVGGEIIKDPNGIKRNVRKGQPLKSQFRRVAFSEQSVKVAGETIPLVRYKDINYIDLAYVTCKGFSLATDDTKKTIEIQRDKKAKKSAIPTINKEQLILERGFVAVYGSESTALLSIGERHYIPCSTLASWGITVEVE